MSHQPTEIAQLSPDAVRSMRICIAVSRYHSEITSVLARGAVDAFIAAGGDTSKLTRTEVPGSWELIPICRAMAFADEPPAAIIALGCVITGETTHDQFINTAVSSAFAQIIVKTGIPIAFGVLTCQSIEQARQRAGGQKGNKGAEAMSAALEAAATLRAFREHTPGPTHEL